MDYKVIDIEKWERREFFEHYINAVPCTYSLTVKIDVTNIKRQNLKLFPALLYCLTKTVNKYEEFRTALRNDGELVVYSAMQPCYTVFHKDTKTFSNLWTEFTEDYAAFARRYEADVEKYGKVEGFVGRPNVPENSFTVSALPWISFEGFNLNVKGFDYLLPVFTAGKCTEAGGRYTLPLAVQVHHAVCDGYCASCFINDLQAELNNLAGTENK